MCKTSAVASLYSLVEITALTGVCSYSLRVFEIFFAAFYPFVAQKLLQAGAGVAHIVLTAAKTIDMGRTSSSAVYPP